MNDEYHTHYHIDMWPLTIGLVLIGMFTCVCIENCVKAKHPAPPKPTVQPEKTP